MNTSFDDDPVSRLAKIIDEHSHEWISTHDANWKEPSYVYWLQRKEASVKLALKILNAGYSKEND